MAFGLDIDIGKFVSRSLGIGESSVDEAFRTGASIATGDVAGAIIGASQLVAAEKERKREQAQPAPTVTGEQPVYYSQAPSGQARESGGYIDIPPAGAGRTVYEGFVGQIPNIIGGIVGGLARGARTPLGGAAIGAAGGLLAGNGDACGCGPKPFVRFNKCGEPIITRKMKKQAIEAVNCSGPAEAARALTGGDAQLLTMILSKQFPPRRMGISGAQLNTTMRTMTKLDRAHKKMQSMCKPTRSYTRRK